MSTSSSNRDDSPPLHATEFRQMFLDSTAYEQVINEVSDNTTAIVINNLHFLAQTIERLETEVDRQRTEYNDVFEFATQHQHFRRHLRPVLRNFRRRSRNPYPQTTTSPSLRSDRSSEESLPVLFPIDNPPQTVEIHSLNPNNNENSSPSPETTSLSFQTANEGPLGSLGSPSNPINVDLIPDHLVRLNTGMRRSRSNIAPLYCQTCRRHGHTATTCIWHGPIVCGYCMEIGHGRNGCSALRRDVARYNPSHNFCMLCGQPGHTLVQCRALEYQQ
jgi:uncharacterized protein (UPF0335 family)